ncbi:MAG: hypothetical protein RRZ63_08360 [Clostridium sp.]
MPEELYNDEIAPNAGLAEADASDIDPEKQRLQEENDRLREEIERVKALPLKERIYDHVHVSVRTLDIFICIMIILGVAAVVMGMMK